MPATATPSCTPHHPAPATATPSCTPRHPAPAAAYTLPCSTLNKKTAKHANQLTEPLLPPAIHQTANQYFSPKSPAHKRPVLDRAVCGFAAIDIAAVLWLAPKHFAAIQLPRTKHPFPKPRAASGWLPAAAFHPANPQTEASAKFLVPFSKKGTSFRDGNARPHNPRHAAPATRSHLPAPPRPAPSKARCGLRPQTNGAVNPRPTKGQRSPRTPTAPCPSGDPPNREPIPPPRTIQNKRAGTYCARPP